MAQLDTGEVDFSDLLPFGRRRKEYPEPSTPGMLGGFDPQQIQAMMAQFGATEKERNDANKQALFALGFGLLGGRKGNELQTIGRAGLGALDYRNRTLADIPQQKAQQFNAATQMLKLQQAQQAQQGQQAQQERLAGIFGGGGGPNLAAMGPGGPTPQNAAAIAPPSQIEKYRLAAMELAASGRVEDAKRLNDIANSMEAKYSTTPQLYKDASGRVVRQLIGERGETKDLPGGPAEKLHFGGTGGMSNVGFNQFTGMPESPGLPATMSPGELAADARARAALGQAERHFQAGLGPKAQTQATELRKEFNALPQVKAFGEVQPVLQSAREALGQDTAAADLNLIYAAAKIFDPTSVVRESETSLVMGTGSPAERFKGQWNHVTGGGRLTPETRKNLMQQVESRGRGFESGYKQARMAYEGVAKKQGIAPEDVFIEPIPQAPAKAETKDRPLTAAEQAELAALKKKHGR